jgi:NAD(P)-dependent dehydrogenase (short-subunit alcohol dehydrogenase family)
MRMAKKVWFITGSSRGFGREWAEAALTRGDSVAATARDTSALDDLVERYGDQVLALQLDVTDRAADFAAVARAHEHFGRLDVVVNNAGYGLFGTIEEITEEQARAQIETNVFGALWVTQAALPFLREQRSGHFIQVSSIGGIVAFAGIGLYHASKWALEGFSDALSQEVAGFGINVTLVEPGGFDTDWGGSSAVRAEPLAVYEEVHEAMRQRGSVLAQRQDRRDRGGGARGCRCRESSPTHLLRQSTPRYRQGPLRPTPEDVGGVERDLQRRAGVASSAAATMAA